MIKNDDQFEIPQEPNVKNTIIQIKKTGKNLQKFCENHLVNTLNGLFLVGTDGDQADLLSKKFQLYTKCLHENKFLGNY